MENACVDYDLCEHGAGCTQCCWVAHAVRTHTRASVEQHFSLALLSPLRIFRQCNNARCVNMAHMIFTPHAQDFLEREMWYQEVTFCRHGIACRLCHWPWHGLTHQSTEGLIFPRFRGGVGTGSHARRLMRAIFHVPHKDPASFRWDNRCGMSLCMQPSHFGWTSYYEIGQHMGNANASKPRRTLH